MTWDLVVRQLSGEKVALAPAEGRKVIRMGIGQYNKGTQEKAEVREAIVEVLTEFGQMSTSDLYEELIMQSHSVSYEALYGVLKKMAKRGLVLKTTRQAKHGGKGIALWQVAE